MRIFCVLLLTLVAVSGVALWGPFSSAEHHADVTGDFGDPIPGLAPFELVSFQRGRDVFMRRWPRDEGLGPHFNAVSCMSCHEDPAPGGSSQRYRDFYIAVQSESPASKVYGDCTDENAQTQSTELCLPSIVMPHYGPIQSRTDPVAASVAHPPIPYDGTIAALRNAPPIFGVGLFRLVSDDEISSRNDPLDLDGDGISGRFNLVASEDFAIGRFGYKAQTASIEAFNRGALHNQMGITSDSLELAAAFESDDRGLLDRLLGTETAYAQVATPTDRITDQDPIPDPEISRQDLFDLVSFQEKLAAPRRGRITPAVRRGERVFEDIGCTGCHTPSLSIPQGLIFPYTDLLLHDMGEELADGVAMGAASGSEFRTQPLWGLCAHPPFLHDGRADTVAEAILAHGGEGQASRDRYADLDDRDRADLHRFLESL